VEPPQLKALLTPCSSEEMTCWPVSPGVGNVKNNDPSLIEPISSQRAGICGSRRCSFVLQMSVPAVGLHHHRFLKRPIVRVPITTLWQIGYTAKKCPPLDRPGLPNATKREQYFAAPSAPASAGGRAMRDRGPGGGPVLSRSGRCHLDTFACASQSGIVGKPKGTRSFDSILVVLLHRSACLNWRAGRAQAGQTTACQVTAWCRPRNDDRRQ
jgi:hypothetical protein